MRRLFNKLKETYFISILFSKYFIFLRIIYLNQRDVNSLKRVFIPFFMINLYV